MDEDEQYGWEDEEGEEEEEGEDEDLLRKFTGWSIR